MSIHLARDGITGNGPNGLRLWRSLFAHPLHLHNANKLMEKIKNQFEEAKQTLHPANTEATYEEKLKALENLQKIFAILYE